MQSSFPGDPKQHAPTSASSQLLLLLLLLLLAELELTPQYVSRSPKAPLSRFGSSNRGVRSGLSKHQRVTYPGNHGLGGL
jgi:hypothetical protein